MQGERHSLARCSYTAFAFFGEVKASGFREILTIISPPSSRQSSPKQNYDQPPTRSSAKSPSSATDKTIERRLVLRPSVVSLTRFKFSRYMRHFDLSKGKVIPIVLSLLCTITSRVVWYARSAKTSPRTLFLLLITSYPIVRPFLIIGFFLQKMKRNKKSKEKL